MLKTQEHAEGIRPNRRIAVFVVNARREARDADLRIHTFVRSKRKQVGYRRIEPRRSQVRDIKPCVVAQRYIIDFPEIAILEVIAYILQRLVVGEGSFAVDV